ncbi:MAG: ABC-2 family transporter protein [Candidatus Gracilibacteria bacterium]
MKKLFLYFRRITKMSFLTWMQYPQDIFASGIGSVVYTFMQLAFFYFLFTSGKNVLSGYTFQQFYTVFFISQCSIALFFLYSWGNLQRLGKDIEQGNIDLQLIKPFHTAIILQLPKLFVNSFMPMFFIQAVLVCLFFFIGIPKVSLWFFPFSFVLIISSWILLHATYVICISVLFYLKGFWGFYKTAGNFSDLVQYPKDLFPSWIGILFTFCIPYFMVSDPLYRVFKDELTLQYVFFYVLFYVCFLSISSLIWHFGLRRYEGG